MIVAPNWQYNVITVRGTSDGCMSLSFCVDIVVIVGRREDLGGG